MLKMIQKQGIFW